MVCINNIQTLILEYNKLMTTSTVTEYSYGAVLFGVDLYCIKYALSYIKKNIYHV